MKNIKAQILALSKQNKTYSEIMQILNCTRSTVSYHLGKGVRDRVLARQKKRHSERLNQLRKKYGGKCKICGYKKCQQALDFHHINESSKQFEISAKGYSIKCIAKELKKCVLLCSNCHRELHAGLIKL